MGDSTELRNALILALVASAVFGLALCDFAIKLHTERQRGGALT